MTVDDVRRMLKAIEQKQHDDEIAHSLEDGMREDVLRAIAAGECEDPAGCAKIALLSEDIDFSRWYA